MSGEEKKESVEEFLARGGKIQEVPFGEATIKDPKLGTHAPSKVTAQAHIRASQKREQKKDKAKAKVKVFGFNRPSPKKG